MNYFFALILTFALCLKTKAQVPGEIVGVAMSNPDYSFKSLELSTQTDFTLAPLGWRGAWQGNSTFDKVNNRYYYKNGLYIYKVDAATGDVLDSLGELNTFNGIEYNETCDCLMGIYVDLNTSEVFLASVDFNTKNLYLINTVESDANYFGESTFDQVNQRYFRARWNTVEVLDALGNQLALLPRPGGMASFEYDETMDRLVGMYFSATKLVLTSVDIGTQQTLDIDSVQLTASVLSGESTFDQVNQRYFFRTMDEIYAYSFPFQGFETFADPFPANITGIEFKGPPPPVLTTGISENRKKENLSVYPNPAERDVFFRGLTQGSRLRIFNTFGNCVYDEVNKTDKVHLTLNEAPGLYLYEVSFKDEVKTGKLILK